MITTDVEKRASDVIKQFDRGLWKNVHTEVQDGGTFLLIAIEAPELSPAEIDAILRQPIALRLNEVVPSSATQDLGSWIVVFQKGGDVFSSILPHDSNLTATQV